METIDFNPGHLAAARRIALDNYRAERDVCPFLPDVDRLPELEPLTANGLGVAAFEDGEMAGFLCCCDPVDHFFGREAGVFVPVHAHGARGADPGRVYAALYRKAAEKWVGRRLFTHAVACYYHDEAVVRRFFQLGFGMRCIDAAKTPQSRTAELPATDRIEELPPAKRRPLLDLKHRLDEHLSRSPVFMPAAPEEAERRVFDPARRYFAYLKDGEAVAMLGLAADAETFVSELDATVNICDAFCLPEYRGGAVMAALLQQVENTVSRERYTLLGVDFESLNPAALGFWLKHFTAYTCSLVRRIDERIGEGRR